MDVTPAELDAALTAARTPNYCECNGIEYPPCGDCMVERALTAAADVRRQEQQERNARWRAENEAAEAAGDAERESFNDPRCGCPDRYRDCPVHNPSAKARADVRRQRDSWQPHPIDLIHEARTALRGSSPADPRPPKAVWEQTLADIRALAADVRRQRDDDGLHVELTKLAIGYGVTTPVSFAIEASRLFAQPSAVGTQSSDILVTVGDDIASIAGDRRFSDEYVGNVLRAALAATDKEEG